MKKSVKAPSTVIFKGLSDITKFWLLFRYQGVGAAARVIMKAFSSPPYFASSTYRSTSAPVGKPGRK